MPEESYGLCYSCITRSVCQRNFTVFVIPVLRDLYVRGILRFMLFQYYEICMPEESYGLCYSSITRSVCQRNFTVHVIPVLRDLYARGILRAVISPLKPKEGGRKDT
jgi:hypothetical protein